MSLQNFPNMSNHVMGSHKTTFDAEEKMQSSVLNSERRVRVPIMFISMFLQKILLEKLPSATTLNAHRMGRLIRLSGINHVMVTKVYNVDKVVGS